MPARPVIAVYRTVFGRRTVENNLNGNRPFLGTPDPPAPIEATLHRGNFASAFNFLQNSFHILHC